MAAGSDACFGISSVRLRLDGNCGISGATVTYPFAGGPPVGRYVGKSVVVIKLPTNFSFRSHSVHDFNPTLAVFNWSLSKTNVLIDFTGCRNANYQALALVVLYVWHLRINGCSIDFRFNHTNDGPTKMWRLMGALGWYYVLYQETQQFKGSLLKPLVSVRAQADLSRVLSRAEAYTKGFNVEYEKTLRYVISELLYNTMEHGKRFFTRDGLYYGGPIGDPAGAKQCPSIVQFTWYRNRKEMSFIVADLGVGIKKHLENAYPPFANDAEAIRYAIRPGVSGTFHSSDPYKVKNNAGVGLFISSSIVRRLKAEMYIVSRSGVLHISPRDMTSSTLVHDWPGTFVLVNLKLTKAATGVNLHQMMSEFREAAARELFASESQETENRLYVNIANQFGIYAEDKQVAIEYRDRELIPIVNTSKEILIDFNTVVSAPHSFLSALLATPIRILGMQAYKRLKIVNAAPEIRETIDFILDENTVADGSKQ
jgi:hypothetical protein